MSTSVLKLSPTEVYDFVVTALLCGQVPYIAGPPAIGKSQVVHQVADDSNALMIDMRLSQKLSEDMTGLPERDSERGKAVYLPFDDIPLEGDPLPKGFDGWILFLDELSSASEEVLAASYSLLLDRTIGGKKLHDKCRVVAAGNRAADSAIARELPDTIITRVLACEMGTNVNDWKVWAKGSKNRNDSVIGFIEKNANMLYAPTNPKDRDELEIYSAPRGWEKAMTIMNFHEAQAQKKGAKKKKVDAAGVPVAADPNDVHMEPIPDGIFHLLSGAVGPLASRSFREDYDEAIQLPYPWEIAQSPSSSRIPSNSVGKAKITSDLVKYYLEVEGQSRDNVLTYMNRVGGEYSELFLNQVKSELGTTNSDRRLVEAIASRLNIDPLLGTAGKGGTDGSQSSF